MVGREIEVLGEVYPGYAGVKGLYIEAVGFERVWTREGLMCVWVCDFEA
jgi:hypothetical protein